MYRLLQSINASNFLLVGTAMLLVLITVGIPFFSVWVDTLFKATHFLHFVVTYLFLLFLMFLFSLWGNLPAKRLGLAHMLLLGVVFGYLSGIIAHSLHLVVTPGGLERLLHSMRSIPLKEYILLAVTFATILGLWIYGVVVGAAIWLLQRWAHRGHEKGVVS